MKIDYFTINVPKDYKCNRCKATKCKLWRESGGFPCGDIILECVDCAIKSQNDPKITLAFVKSAAQIGFAVAEDGMYMDCYVPQFQRKIIYRIGDIPQYLKQVATGGGAYH